MKTKDVAKKKIASDLTAEEKELMKSGTCEEIAEHMALEKDRINIKEWFECFWNRYNEDKAEGNEKTTGISLLAMELPELTPELQNMLGNVTGPYEYLCNNDKFSINKALDIVNHCAEGYYSEKAIMDTFEHMDIRPFKRYKDQIEAALQENNKLVSKFVVATSGFHKFKFKEVADELCALIVAAVIDHKTWGLVYKVKYNPKQCAEQIEKAGVLSKVPSFVRANFNKITTENNFKDIARCLLGEIRLDHAYELYRNFPYTRDFIEDKVIGSQDIEKWADVGGVIESRNGVSYLMHLVESAKVYETYVGAARCVRNNKELVNKVIGIAMSQEGSFSVLLDIAKKVDNADIHKIQDHFQKNKEYSLCVAMLNAGLKVNLDKMKEFMESCPDKHLLHRFNKAITNNSVRETPYHKLAPLAHVLMPKLPLKIRELEKKYPGMYSTLKKEGLVSDKNKDAVLTKEALKEFIDSKPHKKYPVTTRSYKGDYGDFSQRSHTQKEDQLVLCITLNEEDKYKLKEAGCYNTYSRLVASGHFDVPDLIGWARLELDNSPAHDFVLIDEIQSDVQGDSVKYVRQGRDTTGDYAKILEVIKDFEDVAMHTVSLFARANGYKHIYNHTFEGGKKLKPGSDPHIRPYSELPKSHYFYKVKENTPFNLPAEFYKREASGKLMAIVKRLIGEHK
jgi:hypothetical protein